MAKPRPLVAASDQFLKSECQLAQKIGQGDLFVSCQVRDCLPCFAESGANRPVDHFMSPLRQRNQTNSSVIWAWQTLDQPGLFEPIQAGRHGSRIVEVVTDLPFEQVLEERVLRPAAADRTLNETGQELMLGRAMPYRLGSIGRRVAVKNAPGKDLRFLTGAGSIYSTAEDLWRIVQATRTGIYGKDIQERFFSEEGRQWESWSGRTNGYESSVDVLPGSDLIFVFLSNLQSASNWQLREQVQRLLQGQETNVLPLPPAVQAEFEEATDLIGEYGPAEIQILDGRLFRGDNEFYPIHSGLYYIPASASRLRFRRDAGGRVDALISIRPGGQEQVLERTGGR